MASSTTFHAIQSGAHASDYLLAALGGLGDTYFIAALAQAFKRRYCTHGEKLILIVEEYNRELAELFVGVDGVCVLSKTEADGLGRYNRCSYPIPGEIFYASPNEVSVRPDYCVAYDYMSDAVMYAMILGLPPLSLLTLPVSSPVQDPPFGNVGRTVILVPYGRSWPRISQSFWDLLTAKLSGTGWDVVLNDAEKMPIRSIIPIAERAGWVIGANCGLMQMLVAGRARCRKTVVTQAVWPDLEDGERIPHPITSTMSFRRFRKIDGNKYDIEEFRVDGPDSFDGLTTMISQGRNARGLSPSPEPLTFVDVETSPGDVIDKLTILHVKIDRLPHKAYSLYRDVLWFADARDRLVRRFPSIVEKEKELFRLNYIAWDNNQILIDDYEDQGYASDAWSMDDVPKAERVMKAFGAAHRSNQRRVRIKNEINELCGAGMREEKSYD